MWRFLSPLLLALCTGAPADGEGAEGAAGRRLVSSSSRDGCGASSARCVHMYAASGSPDLVSIEYRVPSGQGDLRPMFEDLSRRQVGSALSGPFQTVDFSALFTHAANNSVYVEGSFSFGREVADAAVTVFTARPGHELFMLSASPSVASCAAPRVPVVLGNGLSDGATAFARVTGNGVSTPCVQVANGGSPGREPSACLQPAQRAYTVHFFRDSACRRLSARVNASLVPSEVERAAGSGRAFAAFAVLLGDSHLSQPFVSYADPIARPPAAADSGAATALARFFSGRTLSVLLGCLAALACVCLATGVHSWKSQIDFGDVVLYRALGSAGGEELGIAVAVLDCSHGVKYRNASRSLVLQPIRVASAAEQPLGGLRVLREEDGAISGGDLSRRILSRAASNASSADAGASLDPAPPAAPPMIGIGTRSFSSSEFQGLEMGPAPPPPGVFISGGAPQIDAALPSPARLDDSPPSPALDGGAARPTEAVPTPGRPPLGQTQGQDTYVFVEDATRSPLAFVRKTFLMTLVDDVYAVLYCVLAYPVLLMCSVCVPGSSASSAISVAPDPSAASGEQDCRGGAGPRRWDQVSLFSRRRPGHVHGDDVAAVLSGDRGGDYRGAAVARVNRHTLQQFLRLKEQSGAEGEGESLSIERLMNDRRIRGTGGSGGDLRALTRTSSSGSLARASPPGREGPRRRRMGTPTFWPRQLGAQGPRLGEDDDECLPFIREVWDEMQEEMEMEDEMGASQPGGRGGSRPASAGASPGSEFYIVAMDTSIFDKIAKR